MHSKALKEPKITKWFLKLLVSACTLQAESKHLRERPENAYALQARGEVGPLTIPNRPSAKNYYGMREGKNMAQQ